MKRFSAQIDPDWTMEALLDARPEAMHVLLRHGMACIGCAMAPFETVVEAAREYDLDLSSFIDELQRAGPRRRRRSGLIGHRHRTIRKRQGCEAEP
jgi:hybrid cluster-associated redox disulfide protein